MDSEQELGDALEGTLVDAYGRRNVRREVYLKHLLGIGSDSPAESESVDAECEMTRFRIY